VVNGSGARQPFSRLQPRDLAPRPAHGPRTSTTTHAPLLPTAERHARRFRHRYFGTEHLLLALTDNPGLAGTTLHRLGVDAEHVSRQIREIIGEGHSSDTAALGITPRTKRVLEAAGHEARRLNHRCAIAAPEHVLLALSARRDGVAAQILDGFGVDEHRVRHQLSDLLAGEAPKLAADILHPPRRRLRRAARR
jgi:ATP-dependent Clp protease ATP-binding subunit ClpC